MIRRMTDVSNINRANSNGTKFGSVKNNGKCMEFDKQKAPTEFYIKQTHLTLDDRYEATRDDDGVDGRNGNRLLQDSDDKTNLFGIIPNPFVLKCQLNSTIDVVTTALFTVFVLPVRVIFISVLLFLAWIFSTIGLWGLTINDISAKPLSKWRRTLRTLTAYTLRGTYIAGSFHNVKIIGRRASRKEAPVLALAPHSSFYDSLVVVWLNPLSVLAKAETATIPIFGKLINFTQPLYVWRDDSNSRQKTIKGIIDRAISEDDWPQVIIFPEGTCTNRSCLITFQGGAFYPGVPVQPVCIRYPNKFDAVTWTWEGAGVLKLLWLTMCTAYTRCEIEFLPVYIPSEEEKKCSKLFATNVRRIMARALGVPTSDYTYSDCKLMAKARQMNFPYAANIVEIQKLRHRIGLTKTIIEEQVVSSYLVHDANSTVSLTEFALRLQISVNDNSTINLFSIFDETSAGNIDFRKYLFCALVIIKADVPVIELVQIVSKMYDDCGKGPGRLTPNALHCIIGSILAISFDDCIELFTKLDINRKGFITIDQLTDYFRSKSEYEHIFTPSNGASRTTSKVKKQKSL